jgi:hypothetical protein
VDSKKIACGMLAGAVSQVVNRQVLLMLQLPTESDSLQAALKSGSAEQ